MTDEKIKALIAQVKKMIAEQEGVLKMLTSTENWSQSNSNLIKMTQLDSTISGMRQVLAVIRLYEE